MRNLTPGWLLLVLMSLLLTAPAVATLQVVATVSDLGDIAARVGGDEVSVTVLCPGHHDPHFLPAKPSLARKLGKADLLIYTGLELEIGWLPLLVDASRNPRVQAGQRGELDCSQALDRILDVPTGEIDRSHGDVHALGNPHYLLDPRNGVAVASLLAERLAELAPAAAAGFRQRAEAFADTVGSRLPDWEEVVAPLAGRPMVVYHQQWEYLLDWLGLELLDAIENRPGISPSPRHVEELVQRGLARGNAVVIAAPWNHLDAAQHAANRMSAPMLVLPAAVGARDEATDYLALFDTICRLLASAGS